MIKSNIPHFMVDENWQITACDSTVAEWMGHSVEDVVGKSCFDMVDGHNLDGSSFCRPVCPLTTASRHALTINPVMILNNPHTPRQIVRVHYVILDNPKGILHFVRPLHDASKSSPKLTKNQLQLVQGLAMGLTHRQIAEQNHIALSTVTTQLKRIRRTLSCASDRHLVTWYWNQEQH
ncbi:LuxR C-terminal-related transcriptional regulator [Sulfobacillus thermosulfidooxidans]|uniref:LuxR C-terminal-related transcriptional regulator n=1 Tax=Sulfobacillus thermosulfidooxidans TaxID=28034 RepID=UPI0006B6416E|nr:LuxR C-terminal-related transcriptional regulator [Sulfobacillus thermosulfidooxidans]